MTPKDYVLEKPDGRKLKCLQSLSLGCFSTKRQKAGRLRAPQWRSDGDTGMSKECPHSLLKVESQKIAMHERRPNVKDQDKERYKTKSE